MELSYKKGYQFFKINIIVVKFRLREEGCGTCQTVNIKFNDKIIQTKEQQ